MATFDAEVLGETLKMDGSGWEERQAIRPMVQFRSDSRLVAPQMAVNGGRAKEDVVRARMIEHDEHVGAIFQKLKDLGVYHNTIVVYSTDNGNELMEDAHWGQNAQQLVRSQSYPSVPYLVNLLMDPMEKMTPDSDEFGYIGREFFAHKLWAPTAATPFLAPI